MSKPVTLETKHTDQPIADLVSAPQSFHTEQRFEELLNFVQVAFPNHIVRLDSLPGDASFRRYHRIFIEEQPESLRNGVTKEVAVDDSYNVSSLDPSYIVMDAPPQLESIESFVRIDELMTDKVNVPNLLARDIEQGFLILQDFGSTEFAHLTSDAKNNQDLSRIDELYRWAIDALIELQSIDIKLAKEAYDVKEYDAPTLNREMALFSEWFLPYIDVELDRGTQDLWHSFNGNLISELLTHPKVVVHRDYHSRNLMLDQYHPEQIGIIDFQDALIGSYTYDLVSLLRDAYVEWDENQVKAWVEYYFQQVRRLNLDGAKNITEFTVAVNFMGVQRHLKILGIFVRLAERDGKTRYLADIPKVWKDLKLELKWLSEHADSNIQHIVCPFLVWLEEVVEPNYKKKFDL